MIQKNLSDLSDEQLLIKLKGIRTAKIVDAVLVGLTVGIVIYGAIKNGFGFFTFVPLILIVAIIRNSKNNKNIEIEIQNELAARRL